MTTTTQNAIQTRKAQFADLDNLLALLGDKVADLKAKTADLGPDNWAYTGRGSDLARIQHDLAVALGKESDR